jgi:O-antigen ligase
VIQQFFAYFVGYGSLGVFYAMTFTAALLLVGAALVAPRLAGLGLLLVVVIFPGSAATAIAGEYGWNVFGKGQRFFFFSIVELLAMAMGLVMALHHWVSSRWHSPLVRSAYSGHAVPPGMDPATSYRNPYVPYYLGFFLLVLGWAMSDALLGKDSWLAHFGRSGVWTIVVQGLLLSAIVRMCATEKLLFDGFHIVAGTIGAVVVYGLIRYAFLGGDPQGVYETEGAQLLRLTFWDINYLVFATALGGWLLWRAAEPGTKADWPWREALALLAFLVVALSARRSAQVGVLVVLITLAFFLPRGRKGAVLVMLALTFVAVGYKLSQRIDDNRPLLTRLIQGDERQQFLFDPRYDRYYELRVAWRDVAASPVLGVGPAGSFNPPSHRGLEYHRGNYTFVHSGFGHVLLKTGFVGLALLLGLLATYVAVMVRLWRASDHRRRGLLIFSGAGMLAFVPTLMIGTPFIELRTAMAMGMLLAIPIALRRVMPATVPAAPQPLKAKLPLRWVPVR